MYVRNVSMRSIWSPSSRDALSWKASLMRSGWISFPMTHMNSSKSIGFMGTAMISEGKIALGCILGVISEPVSNIGYFPYSTSYFTS